MKMLKINENQSIRVDALVTQNNFKTRGKRISRDAAETFCAAKAEAWNEWN